MSPAVSVIVPTRGPAAGLPRLLGALAAQTLPAASFEVLLVTSGSREETAAAAQGMAVPFPLTVVACPHGGAAAARNFGARLAAAPLLVFLDDDMEAAPGLLAAHAAAQRGTDGAVGLGHFTVPPAARSEAPLAVAEALRGDLHFSRLLNDAHRKTFLDLLPGNLSLPRAVFDAVGGFDEAFVGRRGEGAELGARLMARRVPFRFIPEATALHHSAPSLSRFCRRAFETGRGDVLIARKHAELADSLPLLEVFSSPRRAWLLRQLRRSPAAMGALATALRPPMALAGALRRRPSWERMQRLVHYCCYWRGVVHECGSAAASERLLAALPTAAPPAATMRIDLARDLPRLADLLAANPVNGLTLAYGDRTIGRIAARPGAEPLRPPHVRHALVHHHGTEWKKAMMAARAESHGQELAALMLLVGT